MGEAKRRAAMDPTHGQPAVYEMRIFDWNDAPYGEIPFAVPRKHPRTHQDDHATRLAVLIFSVLQEPTPDTRDRLGRQLSPDDAAAVLGYAEEMPERFWCEVFEGDEPLCGFTTDPRDGFDKSTKPERIEELLALAK